MAVSKVLIASIFLSLLVIHQVQALQTSEVTSNAVADNVYESKIGVSVDCRAACAARCKLSKRPNLCRRVCGTCCFRCNCVPPGTYGNFAACPCYATLKTRNNRLKCP